MTTQVDRPAGPAYRILGPIEVGGGGRRQLRVPPGRQQIVLGALLLEANRLVSIDKLIDVLWYDSPPATARTQVQICVSTLRNNLAKIGMEGAILTRSPGYLLQVAEDELDAELFAKLVGEANELAKQQRPAEAAQLLRQAIGLWRGPALSGTASRTLQAKAAQLDENRLSAIETCLDLELQLGQHHQLIGEISVLVNDYPLRERLRSQLMLALYRSGRQAEALDTYRAGRELLIDQLGLEPSNELRDLEAAVLAGDTSLLIGEPPAAASTAPQITPLQLPADTGDFTGRGELIEEAGELLLGGSEPGDHRATRVVVMVGKPGIGKSALAVHVAHRLRDPHFPDGQLYCDLGGTGEQPMEPGDVLSRFIRALGVPGSAIPESVDERAAVYRSLLARKKMLVVLDDAAAESQVRALLPGSPSCAVIVTSRSRLTGLAGANMLELDVLDPDQSLQLLVHVMGQKRVSDEPAAAEALIRLVGGLPLALRIVAARLAARPRWSLAWMMERLADERRRLDELAHGEMMVRASLALTYNGLAPDARRLLRLLSSLDGMSYPVWTAAALLDEDYFHAADLLELLVDAQMLEVADLDLNGSPRYKFHEIIRLFAREQLEERESTEDRRAALARVAGGWLAIADEAHRKIYGGDFTVLHGTAPRWQPSPTYVGKVLSDPLNWLEAEHFNLCSAVSLTADAGLHEPCWDLAVTLVSLFESRCYFENWERTHHKALGATRAAGNQRGTAALLCSLGSLYLSRAQPAAAEEVLAPALGTFEQLGDPHGLAMTERNLAWLDRQRGNTTDAAGRYRQALENFSRAGDLIGQAHVLTGMARLEMDAGAHTDAGTHLREALAMCHEVGSSRVEVQVRYLLSGLLVLQGRYAEADRLLAGLLDTVRAAHDLVGEARILHRLGTISTGLGRPDEAEHLLRSALAVREKSMDFGGVEEVRIELARLLGARSATAGLPA
ncbi:AfsR/SARP family transcriptional regulator [Amycolatopsis nigrescens]|uniref:AfsR/SARP family transcriptional regulator n=1 Tax=Amycolatopsis nigrescens TaxID=381445 RepID=UPI00039B9C9D|nr:AfsR/SARP family transcriptional regulator [Amycolatopsis nigrescens]